MRWIVVPNREEARANWGFTNEAARVVCRDECLRGIGWDNKEIPSECDPFLVVLHPDNMYDHSLEWVFGNGEVECRVFAHFGANRSEFEDNPRAEIKCRWENLAGNAGAFMLEGGRWGVLPYSIRGGMSWWDNHLRKVSQIVSSANDGESVDLRLIDQKLDEAWTEAYSYFFYRLESKILAEALFPVYVAASAALQHWDSGGGDEYKSSLGVVLEMARNNINKVDGKDWEGLVNTFNRIKVSSDRGLLKKFCDLFEDLSKAFTEVVRLS